MSRQPRATAGPRSWVLLAVGAAVALVAGLVGGFIGASLHPTTSTTGARASSGGGTCDVTTVADKLLPSTVTVLTVTRGGGGGNGTGSVLDTQGDILTNNHVISAVAAAGGTITVQFGQKALEAPARIVGRDPLTDLAVLRVEADASALTPIAIGSSASLNVGQPVVAAGAPLGLANSVTSGIVSALSRYVNVGDDQPAYLVNAIQTDAPINPGNSGGPLVNCQGQQIGVNTAGAQVPSAGPSGGGSIGLNFAIPIDFAQSVAKQLIETGTATHQVIGVQAVTVTQGMSQAASLPRGALVQEVIPGFGAAAAGIRTGDVITKIGDTEIQSVDEMLLQVRAHAAGERVDVTYTRNGSSHTVPVTITGA